jgi:hypothetical protein
MALKEFVMGFFFRLTGFRMRALKILPQKPSRVYLREFFTSILGENDADFQDFSRIIDSSGITERSPENHHETLRNIK